MISPTCKDCFLYKTIGSRYGLCSPQQIFVLAGRKQDCETVKNFDKACEELLKEDSK